MLTHRVLVQTPRCFVKSQTGKVSRG